MTVSIFLFICIGRVKYIRGTKMAIAQKQRCFGKETLSRPRYVPEVDILILLCLIRPT